MPQKGCILILSSLIIAFSCSAQDMPAGDGFGTETNFFVGKVIKHTPKFRLPIPKLTSGVDINFLWKTNGKASWQQRRNYPAVGIGFAYTNYGIDAIYGRCFSVYPNIVIPLITGKKLAWTLRIGDGIGYVTRDYSRFSPLDTANNAIGSHFNDYFSFLMDTRYSVNDHWDIQMGLNFSHISNATYHQPNLGVNMLGAHVGLRYFPVSSHPKKIVSELKPLSNRILFQFRLGMALSQANAPLGPEYPIYVATGYVSKRWISKNKFFVGADYSYHSDIYAYLRNNSFVPVGTEASHSYKSGVFAGNEFLLGRVGAVIQIGYYTHQAALHVSDFYEKIGGHFYLVQKEKGPVKELFLSAYLKTHSSVAEFAEFGFGLGF